MPIPLGILAVAGAGAAGGGAYDLLETTLISTNTASVTFSNLNTYSAYKHLQIRAVARTARTAFSLDAIDLQFNGDTANNYAWHSLVGNGSSVTSFAAPTSLNPSAMTVAQISSNLAPSGAFGAGVIDILDFSNTSKNTTIRSLAGYFSDSSRREISLRSGVWLNTAAVTSLTLKGQSDSFVSGTRFSLYGIK